MPTEYIRKGSTKRGEWSAEQLSLAIDSINNGNMGVNEASRQYGIPCTTLRRRLRNRDVEKRELGPTSTLGKANEAKLVAHIKKLQNHGFAPNRSMVRSMAFELAEKLKIRHNFNIKKRKAGYPWLESFLRRNKQLSIRKSEGVSIARSLSVNKTDVESYFSLLENILQQHNLMNKPGNIYNIDETGLQLNNRPGHVVAVKGSKNVVCTTACEKGETITVVCCCNAEGSFIPPTCIFKGKNKKSEFEDGMPPGSMVFMSEKSAYINNDLFLKWLQKQFVPRKPPGKVLLLLDGHASHCNSIEMLEYANENDIIIVCLPSHTTQFLQPLDRGFFKSFKHFYYEACNHFLRTHPERRINRLQFGHLLASAWEKSATVKNGVSSFKATGVFPFDPFVVPEYAYLNEPPQRRIQSDLPNSSSHDNIVPNSSSHDDIVPNSSSHDDIVPNSSSQDDIVPNSSSQDDIVPNSSSHDDIVPNSSSHVDVITNTITEVQDEFSASPTIDRNRPSCSKIKTPEKITPGKLLDDISPVQNLRAVMLAKKRGKQLASILTSVENITMKKQKQALKNKKACPSFVKKINKTKSRKIAKSVSSSSESAETVTFDDSSDYSDESNTCCGCGEEYEKTLKKDDWIRCIQCLKWLHEGCSKYLNFCNICGKHMQKKK